MEALYFQIFIFKSGAIERSIPEYILCMLIIQIVCRPPAKFTTPFMLHLFASRTYFSLDRASSRHIDDAADAVTSLQREQLNTRATGKREKVDKRTYMHIVKALVNFCERPVVRDVLVNLHCALEVVWIHIANS